MCSFELMHQSHERHSSWKGGEVELTHAASPIGWFYRGLSSKMCATNSSWWGPNSSSVMIQRSVIDIDSAFVFWVAQSVVINGVRLTCDLISHSCTNNNGSVSHRLQWHKHQLHRHLDRWSMIALHPYPLRHYPCCLHRSLAAAHVRRCVCVCERVRRPPLVKTGTQGG